MSLDIDLRIDKKCPHCNVILEKDVYVFDTNITHNLSTMASKAGIYYAVWNPEKINITQAKQVIPYLEKGLKRLKSVPEKYKKYDSDNGWGIYKDFVPWLEEYLEACKEYPEATIYISR